MNHNSLVRSVELEFSYNSAKFSFEEALGKLMVQLMPYSVAVEVVSVHRRDAAGWPWIRLYGPPAGMERALWHGWSAGASKDEKSQIVAAMIEDDYTSGVGLCTFCREAFDKDAAHQCGEIVRCEVCGSRSINYLGEMLHFNEDCFK